MGLYNKCFSLIGCYTFCKGCIHEQECMDDDIEFAVGHDNKFLPFDNDFNHHCGFRRVIKDEKEGRRNEKGKNGNAGK